MVFNIHDVLAIEYLYSSNVMKLSEKYHERSLTYPFHFLATDHAVLEGASNSKQSRKAHFHDP